uniref:Putative chromosome 1-partitioning protein parB probable chromosome I-partitioning protein parB n=1 Tax=biofilter metagenome TaxID=1070537 RepID=A0A1A7GDP3_9ZZZZ
MSDPVITSLPLESLVASLTNPRTTFNAATLNELAETIKEGGVHQPILVRPLPGARVPDTPPGVTHEIVAGERRFRASRIAGAPTIPVWIRELSDAEAEKIQLIENVQREDLKPIEKAEGYARLLRETDMSRADLAKAIGQSTSYVNAALKLLDLGPEGRKAVDAGELDASRALLIARLPSTELQAKATKAITKNGYYNEPMSYRAASEYIQREFMLRLNDAKFSKTDEGLIPDAGSCKACPKRTGANPELFTDVKGADVCTDTACYRAKETAHAKAQLKAARESDATLIEGKEARALMPNSWTSRVEGHFRLDDAADSPTKTPLRKLISKEMEKAGITPVLIANPHKEGEIIATLPVEQVTQLLHAAGQDKAAQDIDRDSKQDAKYKAEQAAREAKNKLEARWRWQVLEAIWPAANERYPAFSEDMNNILRFAAQRYVSMLNTDKCKALCKLLDLGKVAPKDGLTEWIREIENPLAALAVIVAHSQVEYQYWRSTEPDDDGDNEALFVVASGLMVDYKEIERRARSDARADAMKAKKEAKAESKKTAEASAADAPAAQAQDKKGKAKPKPERPAARAGASRKATAPKISEEEARQGIAEAMQSDDAWPMLRSSTSGAMDGTAAGADAGPPAKQIEVSDRVMVDRPEKDQPGHARHGQEGVVIRVRASGKASVRFSSEDEALLPVAWLKVLAQSLWPFPTAPEKAQPPAPAPAPAPEVEWRIGDIARVRDDAKGPNGKRCKTVGKVGRVTGLADDGRIQIKHGERSHEIVILQPEQLEPYTATANPGDKIRIVGTSAGDEYLWRQGRVEAIEKDGYACILTAKAGGIASAVTFRPTDLEVL